jgi:AraC-like DNA-binding protein
MDVRVRTTLELLERLDYCPITLTRLAAHVSLGCSRLGHLFRRDTGLSIRAFVRKRRLTNAAHLIAATDARISEILYAVGFSDPSNFNHAFKLAYGVSPREYRRLSGSTRQNGTPDDGNDAYQTSKGGSHERPDIDIASTRVSPHRLYSQQGSHGEPGS